MRMKSRLLFVFFCHKFSRDNGISTFIFRLDRPAIRAGCHMPIELMGYCLILMEGIFPLNEAAEWN